MMLKVDRSEDHVMSEICSFLTHMEQPRLLEEGDEGKGPMVRTEEEQSDLREKILLGVTIFVLRLRVLLWE